MRIGDVASELGVSADALRFYERAGASPRPPRGENGYRDYSAADVERLRLFIDLRRLDIPVADAGQIAGWCQSGHCSDTSLALPRLLGERRELIRERIAGLERLERQLANLERHLTLVGLPMVGEGGPCCAAAGAVEAAFTN